MAQHPVRRPSGGPPASLSGDQKPPGSIGYEPTDAVGFERMPAAVVKALAPVLLGPPVAADAEQPVTKRRPDGTHYQQSIGWWMGGDRYVAIDARRILAPAEGQKLKPAGAWKIEGTVCHIRPGVIPTSSQWRYDPGASGAGPTKRRARVEDPLDALPPELAAPVREADANAWREYGRGWASETLVAAVVTAERIRVLKAERKSTSRRGLESSDWHAVTLDAPITWIQDFSTDDNGKVVLGQAVRPRSLPTGSALRNRPIGPGR